jgi:hypothetical protein
VYVFFPAAGYRSRITGGLSSLGANGVYWSASFTGTNAYSVYFNSGDIYPSNAGYCAGGFSVRPVKN